MPKNKVEQTQRKIENLNKPVSDTGFKVSGKSVNDLVNLSATQIKNLNRRELSQVVSRLSSAANKRLKRFEKAGIETPATRAVMKTGKFSVKGKDLKQLRTEYKRVKGFLTNETGTRKGYNSFLKRLKHSFAEAGVNIGGETPEEIEQFLDEETRIYDWLAERNPFISEAPYRYFVQQKLSSYIDAGNLSERAIKRRMNKYVKQAYEEQQREQSVDVSDWFDIDGED